MPNRQGPRLNCWIVGSNAQDLSTWPKNTYLPISLCTSIGLLNYLCTHCTEKHKNKTFECCFCPCLLDNWLSYQYISLGCRIEQNTDYFGNDVVSGYVETQQACAAKCVSTPGGLFWTWSPKFKFCYIKSSDSGRRNYPGFVSGNRECGSGRKIRPLPQFFSWRNQTSEPSSIFSWRILF